MTIGNALQTKLATTEFNRLSSAIGELQARISSGINDPRPSADLARAAQLSSLKERQVALTDFAASAEAASNRLSLADTTLGDMNDIATQFQSIALQAATATQTGAGMDGLRSAALALRSALLADANTTDSSGLGLFAGFATGAAFKDGPNGVSYLGDGGVPVARVSESTVLATGISGTKLFQSVTTDQGQKDAFGMIDDLIASLSPEVRSSTTDATVTTGSALLTLKGGRDAAPISFTLSGPLGSATISADQVAGAPDRVVDAINAASAKTGVVASVAADGKGIKLDKAPGAGTSAEDPISVADFDADTGRSTLGTFQALDSTGAPTGSQTVLRPLSLGVNRMVSNFSALSDHFAAQRAQVGAVAAQVERQQAAISARQLQLTSAVSGLEDLDIAKAVTQLQNLELSQQAAQQTFAKIQSMSLFNYLK